MTMTETKEAEQVVTAPVATEPVTKKSAIEQWAERRAQARRAGDMVGNAVVRGAATGFLAGAAATSALMLAPVFGAILAVVAVTGAGVVVGAGCSIFKDAADAGADAVAGL